MTARSRLDAHTQAQLLDLIGVARYVRRTAVSATPPEAATPASTQPAAPVAETRPARAPVAPAERQFEATPRERPSLLAELGVDARTPQLLLFVETPRAPDPRGQLLLAAIRRLLPPHQMLDASDVPQHWLPRAIALGGRVATPADTHCHVAPALSALRQDTAAKRALWRVIRGLRRASRIG